MAAKKIASMPLREALDGLFTLEDNHARRMRTAAGRRATLLSKSFRRNMCKYVRRIDELDPHHWILSRNPYKSCLR